MKSAIILLVFFVLSFIASVLSYSAKCQTRYEILPNPRLRNDELQKFYFQTLMLTVFKKHNFQWK